MAGEAYGKKSLWGGGENFSEVKAEDSRGSHYTCMKFSENKNSGAEKNNRSSRKSILR